jgi:RNA-dependent RNA polymerase
MEAINYAVKFLRKEARTWFNKGLINSDFDSDAVDAKASAWYHFTYHYSYWGRYNKGMDGAHFLSFPWCIGDKLHLCHLWSIISVMNYIWIEMLIISCQKR